MRLILIIIVIIVALGKVFTQSVMKTVKDEKKEHSITAAVEKARSELPMTVGDRIQFDSIEYANNVVKIYGKQVVRKELTDEEKDKLKNIIRQSYCHGKMQGWLEAKVTVEYNLTTQPRTLDDLHTETWTVAVKPENCV
ncbi:hypothetical protein ACO0K9_05610 [Undibacterium sp. Ji50W]|uniref:hypothetical protein n=1 Tax=Undibacterium sp. Ji50W TaxID=3413041 RepID=UPI003BF0FE08